MPELETIAYISVFFALVCGLCAMAFAQDCEDRDNGFDEDDWPW